MQLTTQQQAFIDALLNTTANIALVARAGCGKTSTILIAVEEIARKHEGEQVETLIVAYNKDVAEEVRGKLLDRGIKGRVAEAKTSHSLGQSLLYRQKPTLDPSKVRRLIQAHYTVNNTVVQNEWLAYSAQIAKLVSLAKQEAFGHFTPVSDRAAWFDLADKHDVNGFDRSTDIETVVSYAQTIYSESLKQRDVIDFDDMILHPLVFNLTTKFKKQYIFVDEAQDTSKARQAIIRKFLADDGRIIVVGDDRQAIYGFAGADSDALPNLISTFDCTVLPLSITFRCGKAIVRKAQKYVPDITAADTNEEGEVLHLDGLPTDLAPGDAILCRNTAPLIERAYALMRSGRACKVEGRDVGQGFVALTKRWKVTTISALLGLLEAYERREVSKAQSKLDDSKVEAIRDQCETLREICNAVIASGKTQVSDVLAFIDNLFADGAENCVILATYHRSKGREWDRVYLYEHDTRCPSRAARQPWQQQQEANLAYVAITRAKSTLAYIKTTDPKRLEKFIRESSTTTRGYLPRFFTGEN